jgi:competence protein ComEA
MLRRGPNPLELAGVLRRLERLQVGSPPGWVPTVPTSEPPAEPIVTPPSARRWAGVRAFDPGRRGVVVLAVVAVLGAAGGAWYFVRAAPQAHSSIASAADGTADGAGIANDPGPTASGLPSNDAATLLGGSPAPGGAPTGAPEIVVDVVGKVAKPGVLTLPTGSRVVDAIAAAGGAIAGTDLTALNLAGRLIDGEEIFVGIPPPAGPAAQAAGGVVGGSDATSGGAASAPAVVDINTATPTELETLPGVGAVTAQRIVDWRTQHGRFTSVVQLQQVSGIGPAKYAALSGRVKV